MEANQPPAHGNDNQSMGGYIGGGQNEEPDFEAEEKVGFTECPSCSKDYDEIDEEYQICHHCGWDAEMKHYVQNQ